jgi:hypothetical protein
MCTEAVNVLKPLSLNISYPYLIKFHDLADNSQEGMQHQMRGATPEQHGMTVLMTLVSSSCLVPIAQT